MKQKIDVMEQAGTILQAVKKGALLTTKANGRVNTMTISWGMLGIEWNKPLFITVVRHSRYSHELLEQNGEFTVNLPWGAYDPKILSVCGSKSGRDMDKLQELGLTQVEPEQISVPGIAQLPLTLECRVVYKQDQSLPADEAAQKAYYPPFRDGQPDLHTAYYGEIVAAYLAE